MAFVVEDDTGLPDATAYIDVAFYRDYLSDRRMTDPVATGPDRQAAIIRASDFLDRRYRGAIVGVRLNVSQSLEFPRTNAQYRDDHRVVIGVAPEWKQACAELSFRVAQGIAAGTAASGDPLAPDPEYDDTNRVVTKKTEKVGPLLESTEYDDDGFIIDWRKFPTVEGLIRMLITEGAELERA